MHLREAFPFDQPPALGGWKFLQTFAASADRRTFYVEAGANAGVRLLAHVAEDGRWYVAPRLHAETLVRVSGPDEEELMATLRQAADLDAVTGVPVPLLNPWDVPGFLPLDSVEGTGHVAATGTTRHHDVWYTRSERVLPLGSPAWAPTARAYDLREGVYLVFPPVAEGEAETYRLVRRWAYYRFAGAVSGAPIARQGDLLIFGTPWPADWTDLREAVVHPPVLVDPRQAPDETGAGRWQVLDGEPVDVDRHTVRRVPVLTEAERQQVPPHPDLGVPAGTVVVTHPEHAVLRVPPEATWLTLAPGVSRPFARAGGID